jgi:tripartite-type tricarboxylate transporter receptor subunit TctC
MFDPLASTLQHVKGGKLKVLGISSLQRSDQLPNAVPIAGQGLKGFDITSWLGFLVPAGTPPATVTALNAAIRRAAATPELQQSIRATGGELVVTSPAEFGRFLQTEVAKWGQAVTDSGLQID